MPTPQEFALAIAPSSPGKKPSVAGSTPHDFALARAASSPGKKWPSDGFVVADARPPPPKPTTGPPQHKPVVPLSLIEELRLLDDKFKAREKELEAQRELLNQDRDRFEKAVMTKEWSLQRERHQPRRVEERVDRGDELRPCRRPEEEGRLERSRVGE